jgi:hypothetical protein
VVEYLKENPKTVVFGELVGVGHTPARCEPIHKKASYNVFDIYDREFDAKGGRFLGYSAMYQNMYHFKVPVVGLLGITKHDIIHVTDEERKILDDWDSVKSILKVIGLSFSEEYVEKNNTPTSYYFIRNIMLKWAKIHRREGVVVKTFEGLDPLYVKEKVDLPSHGKLKSISSSQTVQLPPLPFSEVMGAINKVHADNGDEFMADKSKAMPAIAKAVSEECKKHLCSQPTGKIFEYYLEYLAGLKVSAK